MNDELKDPRYGVFPNERAPRWKHLLAADLRRLEKEGLIQYKDGKWSARTKEDNENAPPA